jgi:hypothetical protein
MSCRIDIISMSSFWYGTAATSMPYFDFLIRIMGGAIALFYLITISIIIAGFFTRYIFHWTAEISRTAEPVNGRHHTTAASFAFA